MSASYCFQIVLVLSLRKQWLLLASLIIGSSLLIGVVSPSTMVSTIAVMCGTPVAFVFSRAPVAALGSSLLMALATRLGRLLRSPSAHDDHRVTK